MGKVNPKRIPRSQADVDRAYEKGRDDAIQMFLIRRYTASTLEENR